MEPENTIKPQTPFYKSLPFLIGTGLLVLIAVGWGIYLLIIPKSSPTPVPAKVAEEPSIKPLKGLIGIVEAVDKDNSMITVKSETEKKSFPVANDVSISQIVLGVKMIEEGKQITLPTEILYLEDLIKKKGEEVYLVFDINGQEVIQIQIFPKK